MNEVISYETFIFTCRSESGLGHLFIFSQYIIDCIVEIHDEGPFNLNEIYARMEGISKKTAKFKKSFSLLKEWDLFE